MSYFKNFDRIIYQYPDNVQRIMTDLSVRPMIRKEILANSVNFEFYNVTEGEAPDHISNKFYGDPTFHWVIMLANNIINFYGDWPLDLQQFNEYIYQKYKTVLDSDGTTITLTRNQTITYTQFAGSPDNDFTEFLDGTTVRMKPHHFVTSGTSKLEFSYDAIVNNTNLVDAHGNSESYDTTTPVSIYDYESNLNEAKRNIIIPKKIVVDRIVSEIRDILND